MFTAKATLCSTSNNSCLLHVHKFLCLCYFSDKYVEKLMGGTSVAQIFKESGEAYFREYEV